MKELICPNCHKAFTVDEAGYASIVNQVKNAEFDAEINRRLAELHERHKAEEALVAAKAEQQYQQERSRQAQKLSEKEAESARLQTELGHAEEKKKGEISLALAQKDQEIAALQASLNENDSRLKMAVMEEQRKAQDRLQHREAEIAQ